MNAAERRFIAHVRSFYTEAGRHDLPWRKTTKPYRILVSEIMLQQTQVDRVRPKYETFIKRWPTAQALAKASLAEVLKMWQGLGYNRRAKLLHQCAQIITNEYKNRWPRTHDALMTLPGVGPYTAGAILAFAYNQPHPIIETNIRTVYLHHFFREQTDVSETDLLQHIVRTLDQENPRQWYWALMDYGACLKRTHGNPNSRAKLYAKQSKFAGSDRQIRGAIIRTLSDRSVSRDILLDVLSQFEDIRIDAQLEKLMHEGMVTEKKKRYMLPQ